MEGRWKIDVCEECDERVLAKGYSCRHLHLGPDKIVPVIPCDDAAVERALGSMMNAMHARAVANETGGGAPSVRDMVIDMFRAAGETP